MVARVLATKSSTLTPALPFRTRLDPSSFSCFLFVLRFWRPFEIPGIEKSWTGKKETRIAAKVPSYCRSTFGCLSFHFYDIVIYLLSARNWHGSFVWPAACTEFCSRIFCFIFPVWIFCIFSAMLSSLQIDSVFPVRVSSVFFFHTLAFCSHTLRSQLAALRLPNQKRLTWPIIFGGGALVAVCSAATLLAGPAELIKFLRQLF